MQTDYVYMIMIKQGCSDAECTVRKKKKELSVLLLLVTETVLFLVIATRA